MMADGTGNSYDADILAWSERQAGLLRRVGAGETINDQVDWPHIIEEVEAVGRSERSALASHVRTVIEHLAKLQASPATEPRSGWQETVLRARGEIEAVLEASPSLRVKLGGVIESECGRALRIVGRVLALHEETPLVTLEEIRYGEDQVLGDWLPCA